jgi:hypothetical protein
LRRGIAARVSQQNDQATLTETMVQPRRYERIVGLLSIAALLPGCGHERAAAPASYTAYTAPDKAFKCMAPAGWEASSSSSQAVMSGAVFHKGSAVIDITADLQGSLMGDIVRPPAMPTGDLPPGAAPPGMERAVKELQKPPVEKLHEMGRKEVAETMSHYEEQPMKTMQSGLGDARYSEFTAGGGVFSEKIHGYRVTILGGERRVTVICRCPESDWSTLQPAFAKVVGSLTHGGG